MIYHILNGDSLKAQFPQRIEGKIVVARECLVDGDVEGDSLDELFETRAHFMSSSYPECTKEEYYQESVTEIEKITKIPDRSKIFLWFERDLFCQVNLWFVSSLLAERQLETSLVLATGSLQYGFAGMSEEDLINAFDNAISLDNDLIAKLSSLWRCYQVEDLDGLEELGNSVSSDLPFVKDAVAVHVERVRDKRPQRSLLEIVKELNTTKFGDVFREFNRRESIYGFGDLQVKRLLDEVIRDNKLEEI